MRERVIDKALLALLIGVAVASLLWLLFKPDPRQIEDLETNLAQLADRASPPQFSTAAAIRPGAVFSNLTVTEVTVRLDGIARTSHRRAALISLNGQPSEWLTLGQTIGGVTLVAIGTDEAAFDTRDGRRLVSLGPPQPTETLGAADLKPQ